MARLGFPAFAARELVKVAPFPLAPPSSGAHTLPLWRLYRIELIYHNTYSANIGGPGFGLEFGTQKSPYF